MYSTPKKRLFEMKKELVRLKRRMDKKVRISKKAGQEPYSYGLSYHDKTWDTYRIITSDGKCYELDCTTKVFPDIDFRKIVYVDKKLSTSLFAYTKNGVWHYTEPLNDSYDSLKGYYNRKADWSYENYTNKKFHVTEFIYTGND